VVAVARLVSRDIRPDGQHHLTVALNDGTHAVVVQPAGLYDERDVVDVLDAVVADRAVRRDQADRALAI
jgi:hypothetical protein